MNKQRQTIIKSAIIALLIFSANLSFGQVIFSGQPDSIAALNELYNYQVNTSYAPNAPTYSLPTAPAGMSINSSTGLISWTPASMSAGGKVIIQATNNAGTFFKTYNIYITDAVICDTNIVAYWSMDSKQGPNLPDFANGHSANWIGTSEPVPTLQSDAAAGNSLLFAPTIEDDEFYAVADTAPFDFGYNDKFSVSFWFKNQDPLVNPKRNEIIIGRSSTTNSAKWYIKYDFATTSLIFFLQDGSTDHDQISKVVNDNNWHHVVATFENKHTAPLYDQESVFNLYVDKSVAPGTFDFASDNFKYGNLTIGWNKITNEPYSGYLDELVYYKKALSLSEVTSLYNKGVAHQSVCQDGNIAPLISSTPTLTGTQGAAYSYHLTYSEIDGDPVTVSAPVLPAWMTFNTSTKILSGTPGNSNVGNNNVTLRVSDGKVNVDQVFVINVANVDDLPQISSSPDTSVNEDAAYTYTIVATDIDAGSSLTYSAPTLPSWLNFNTTTHILSATPTNTQVGMSPYQDYPVVLRVTDAVSSGYSEQSFTIRVNQVNDAPVINSQNTLSTDEDVPYIFTLADLNVTDVDNVYPTDFTDTILDGTNYTHVGNTITPAANWNGVLSVPIKLSDGSLSVAYSLSITVNAVNDAPAFDSSPITGAIADSLYNYIIITSDAEGQARTLTCTQKPAWLTFTPVAGNGSLIGTPVLANVGNSEVTLDVYDGTTHTQQTFTLEVVATNYPPVITSTEVTSAKAGEVYTYTIVATDEDGDDLTYTAVTKPAWLTFSAGTHTLSGLPLEANVGTHEVSLSVTDGIATDIQSFTITVGTNGIYNISTEFANVYPNPASGSVNFDFVNTLEDANLKIFSMNGELVKELNFSNQKSITLDISDLKSNGYIYLITTDESYQTGKFIIK
jgi:hypothetical protein